MALFLVGSVNNGAQGDPPVTEMVLPANTEPDDLVLIAILAGFDEAGELDPPSANVDDPRFTLLAGSPNGAGVPAEGEPIRNFSVWVGLAGDPTVPVSVNVVAGTDIFGAFAEIQLVVLRDDSGATVELDGRLGDGTYFPITTPPEEINEPPGATLPGLVASDGDGGDIAILALGIYATRIGGLSGRMNLDRSTDLWTPITSEGSGSYLSIYFLAVDLADPPAALDGYVLGEVPSWPSPSLVSETGWGAAAIGVRLAAPPITRQYPLDNGLGLSSAARVYPAPKSQRVIGGHL